MIRIVGRKILMQKGESGAFRVMILDHKGNEVILSEQDSLIFRAKYAMEADSSIRKVSTPIKLVHEGISKIYHIIEFSSADTMKLLTGDYHYELLLDRDHQKSIVVPTSILTIEDSIASIFPEDNVTILEDSEESTADEDYVLIYGDDEDSDEDDIILFEEDNELDYYYSIITSTPLIGNFNAIVHKSLIDIGDGNDDLIII